MRFDRLTDDPGLREFDDEVCAFLDDRLAETDPDHLLRDVHAFNEPLHLALGDKGWLYPRRPLEEGGAGLDPLKARILDVRLSEYGAVSGPAGTTRLVWGGVEPHLEEPMRREFLRGVTSGRTRFCLGYTEPDGGSDIAMAKTRAVRDGDEWVITGSKIFTSWIHCSQYVFLITRTDPEAPKHAGLTMFLVPVSLDGVDFQEVRTISGERTNISYYDDVRVPDRLRIGPVNSGWAVLNGPLSAEHGQNRTGGGLEDPSMGRAFLRALEEALAEAVTFLGSDIDAATELCLGRIATEIEAGIASPGPMGRILCSEAVIRGAAELMDIVGPRGLLPRGASGCIGEGAIERANRYAQGTATYAGTVEVFRTIITRHVLGLPQLDLPGRKAFIR